MERVHAIHEAHTTFGAYAAYRLHARIAMYEYYISYTL